MKNIYRFYFNENDEFLAEVIENGMTYYLTTKNAIDELIEINNMKISKINLTQNMVILKNDENKIVIKNIQQFIDNGFFTYIPNIFSKIRKESAKYMKKTARKLPHKNNKVGRKKIIAGGIVFLMVCSTTSLIQGLNVHNNSYAEEVCDEDNDLDLKEMENNIEKLLASDTNVINTNIDIENNNNIDDNIHKVYLNYELSDDLKKKEYAYNKYHEIVEKYASKWGISSNIVMNILTQETGGMKTNLMEIVFEAWNEEPIKVYNFNENRYDYFKLTNNPTEEDKQKYTIITEKDLENPITNISIGCVLLRKSAEYTDYHILAAITCYNLGKGNMDDVLEKTSKETGQSREEILSDQENLSFYQYTYVPGEGDPEYLSHVFAFLDNYGEVITFKHFNDNHEIVDEQISVFSTRSL